MKKIFLIVGMSGSGKDYNMNNFNNTHNNILPKIPTTTSRPKRDNETDGVDYHFKPSSFFQENQNSFIEMIQPDLGSAEKKPYYGLEKSTLENFNGNGFLILETEGYPKVKKFLDENNIDNKTIFFTIGQETQVQRIIARNKTSQTELDKRLKSNEEFILFFENNKQKADIILDGENQQTPILLNTFLEKELTENKQKKISR